MPRGKKQKADSSALIEALFDEQYRNRIDRREPLAEQLGCIAVEEWCLRKLNELHQQDMVQTNQEKSKVNSSKLSGDGSILTNGPFDNDWYSDIYEKRKAKSAEATSKLTQRASKNGSHLKILMMRDDGPVERSDPIILAHEWIASQFDKPGPPNADFLHWFLSSTDQTSATRYVIRFKSAKVGRSAHREIKVILSRLRRGLCESSDYLFMRDVFRGVNDYRVVVRRRSKPNQLENPKFQFLNIDLEIVEAVERLRSLGFTKQKAIEALADDLEVSSRAIENIIRKNKISI